MEAEAANTQDYTIQPSWSFGEALTYYLKHCWGIPESYCIVGYADIFPTVFHGHGCNGQDVIDDVVTIFKVRLFSSHDLSGREGTAHIGRAEQTHLSCFGLESSLLRATYVETQRHIKPKYPGQIFHTS